MQFCDFKLRGLLCVFVTGYGSKLKFKDWSRLDLFGRTKETMEAANLEEAIELFAQKLVC